MTQTTPPREMIDHAELARLCERARDATTVWTASKALAAIDAIASPDYLLALLAGIAALRAENDLLEVERIGLRSAIFGSHEYDPGLRHGNFIEMARTTEDARRGAVARATEAERKLAEAEGLLRDLEDANDALAATRSQATYLNMLDVDSAEPQLFRLDQARRAARTFLSKEAEAND